MTRSQSFARKIAPLTLLFLLARLVMAAAYHGGVEGHLNQVDFSVFYNAAQDLRNHQPIYLDQRSYYVYSPFLALMLRPLTSLPVDQAANLWTLIEVVLLAACAILFCVSNRLSPIEHATMYALVFITAFRFWPTTLELSIGNVDIVVLFLIVLMYWAERGKRFYILSLLIAVAALIKTWMLGMVFYLLVRRKYREAAATMLAFAIGMFALFAICGFDQFTEFLRQTHKFSYQPSLVTHSIPGIAFMFFHANPHIPPVTTRPEIYWTFLIGAYAILIAGLLAVWRRGRDDSPGAGQRLLGITIISLLLGNTVCHQYYFVLVLPVIWTILLQPSGDRSPLELAAVLVALVVYIAFSIPTPSLTPVPDIYQHGIKKFLILTSFSGTFTLWATMLVLLLRPATKKT